MKRKQHRDLQPLQSNGARHSVDATQNRKEGNRRTRAIVINFGYNKLITNEIEVFKKCDELKEKFCKQEFPNCVPQSTFGGFLALHKMFLQFNYYFRESEPLTDTRLRAKHSLACTLLFTWCVSFRAALQHRRRDRERSLGHQRKKINEFESSWFTEYPHHAGSIMKARQGDVRKTD